MDFTCVEIKNVKYIKLLSLEKKGERDLDLTTIHRDQELAYLNIFLIDKNKNKKLIKSIQINNIHPGHSGIPELHLSVSYDGKRYYKITLKLNGYIYHNSIIDIKRIRKTAAKISNVALVLIAILVLLLMAFFLFPTFNKDSQNKQITNKTNPVVNNGNISTQSSSDSSATDSSATDSSAAEQKALESEKKEVLIVSKIVDDKATVYFRPDSSVLTTDGKSILNQVLNILKTEKNLDVFITGHCAFYGTEKGRQEISTERAQSVYNYFISNGWTPENEPELLGLGLKQIVTTDPVKQNLNRRVEIIIKSKSEE
jgi:outer membrane protein OmpA-like peptidoglycan-associated protein